MVRSIEILLFPDAQMLDATGPAQVFASANEIMGKALHPPYSVMLVAETSNVTCSSGVTMQCKRIQDCTTAPDTTIVSGGLGVNAALEHDVLVDWVRTRAEEVRRLASVCSGAFLLAEAGLLDGRRAATHWSRFEEFIGRYPKVTLERDPIFVRDGKIWTSAGVTAGIDLALAMVEEDHGRAVALSVARELVVFLKRPGGQSQFSAPLALQQKDDKFHGLHSWIGDNLARRLTLGVLAARAGMSERSFSRHYQAHTGYTPAKGVEMIRVEQAKSRLETGDSIVAVSRTCGFGTAETMRRAFLRHLGVTPREWRERFRRA
jgi:transcriptional regulator GlxA family with amidase domain